MESQVLSKWEEIVVLVQTIEIDVRKSARGNASAGVRARKGLRKLKEWSADLVRTMIAERKISEVEESAAKTA